MRFLFIFVLFLSTFSFTATYDSMTISKNDNGVSVSITDMDSKKLGSLFTAYNESLILVRLSEAEDIAFRCSRRLMITICTFTFISSENIEVWKNFTKAYVELDDSSVLKTGNEVNLFFRNSKGETFSLEITYDYFSAKVKNN